MSWDEASFRKDAGLDPVAADPSGADDRQPVEDPDDRDHRDHTDGAGEDRAEVPTPDRPPQPEPPRSTEPYDADPHRFADLEDADPYDSGRAFAEGGAFAPPSPGASSVGTDEPPLPSGLPSWTGTDAATADDPGSLADAPGPSWVSADDTETSPSAPSWVSTDSNPSALSAPLWASADDTPTTSDVPAWGAPEDPAAPTDPSSWTAAAEEFADPGSYAPSTFAPSSNPPTPSPAPAPSAPAPAPATSFTPSFDRTAGAPPPGAPSTEDPIEAARFDPMGSFSPSGGNAEPAPVPPGDNRVRQNKLLTVGVGVVAVLVLGGVGYSVVSNSSSPANRASGSTLPPLSSLNLATPPPAVVVAPTTSTTTAPVVAKDLVWKPIVAPDESYSIELPGDPVQTVGEPSAITPDQPGVTRFEVLLPQGTYVFGYVDQKGPLTNVDKRIDDSLESLRATAHGQILLNEPADVQGQRAHHFKILTAPTAQSDTFEGYVVLTQKRLFILGYGYRRERFDPVVLEHLAATFRFK